MGSGKLGTIVGQHRIWKSVLLKCCNKAAFYISSGFFWLNSDAEPGMVIQDRKGIAAYAVAQKKVPFEVGLPHLIAVMFLKSLERCVFGRLRRINQTIAFNNVAAGLITGKPLNTSRF